MAGVVFPQHRKLPPHMKGAKMLFVCAILGGQTDLQISISKPLLWQRPPNTSSLSLPHRGEIIPLLSMPSVRYFPPSSFLLYITPAIPNSFHWSTSTCLSENYGRNFLVCSPHVATPHPNPVWSFLSLSTLTALLCWELGAQLHHGGKDAHSEKSFPLEK